MTAPTPVEAEALATAARPSWTLPAAWWDEDAAERMADWIRRFGRIDTAGAFANRRNGGTK